MHKDVPQRRDVAVAGPAASVAHAHRVGGEGAGDHPPRPRDRERETRVVRGDGGATVRRPMTVPPRLRTQVHSAGSDTVRVSWPSLSWSEVWSVNGWRAQ